MFTVQRVLKTHWNSRRLDWTRLGRCEHPLTLDWIGLDTTLMVCRHLSSTAQYTSHQYLPGMYQVSAVCLSRFLED